MQWEAGLGLQIGGGNHNSTSLRWFRVARVHRRNGQYGLGADGMPAAPVQPYTFTVAYAGQVTTLPPLPPSVQAAASATATSLSAQWQPDGAEV